MKGDFTRFTWKPEKHYSGVLMQQGRVALDSDSNEQADIVSHLRETGVGDIVGLCGAPRRDGGFDIFVPPADLGDDLIISAGRIYVDGILCEVDGDEIAIVSFPAGSKRVKLPTLTLDGTLLEEDQLVEVYSDETDLQGFPGTYARITDVVEGTRVLTLSEDLSSREKETNPQLRRALTYTAQPDLPDMKPLPEDGKGLYFAYLDVWRRHITALEDPEIRESALGGPDTATRTKTVRQVKLVKVGEIGDDVTCLSAPKEWTEEIAPSGGRLLARAKPEEPPEGPCVVPATAGYTRLENQLYRVEIDKPGKLGEATFKWSPENASIVTEWLDKKDNRLTVKSPGRDSMLGFAPDQWVELTDDVRELTGKPGRLVKLADVEGDVLIIDSTVAASIDFDEFALNPKVRRWGMPDGAILVDVPADNDGWIRLEGGIEVRFENGPFKTGDYWLIPARAFIGEFAGDIEWPEDEAGDALSQPPHGIEHHYCKLALLGFDGESFEKLADCRKTFPAATELLRFFRVGGDGQEAMPGDWLPCKIEAGVTNGQWPVEGARVRFDIVDVGGGTLRTEDESGLFVTDNTNSDGVARCEWRMPAVPPATDADERPCLRVEATLRDDAGQRVSSPLSFDASLSVAAEVAYDPNDCAYMQDTEFAPVAAETVQDALDKLCPRVELVYLGGDGQVACVDTPLPQPLRVGVFWGKQPLSGLPVAFEVLRGSATLENGSPVTNVSGIAEAVVTAGLDPSTDDGVIEITATLNTSPSGTTPPPLTFTARFVDANCVYVDALHVTEVKLVAPNSRLANGRPTRVDELAGGIDIFCDDKVDIATVERPTCFVTLEIPLESIDTFKDYTMIGNVPIVLEPKLEARENIIHWEPVNQQKLLDFIKKIVGDRDRLLARLFLKGNYIWAAGSGDPPTRYLDGEVFGGREPNGAGLTSGDGRRGGDLEMWFWLVRSTSTTSLVIDVAAIANIVVGEVRLDDPLADVKVTLANQEGRTTRTTNNRGEFVFPGITDGEYNVSVQVDDVSEVKPVKIPGPIRAFKAADFPNRTVDEVFGIGPGLTARLADAGVRHPAKIALMQPAKLADILGVSDDRAAILVYRSQRLLSKPRTL